MSHTVDWVEVEKVVSLAGSLRRLPDDTKAVIKKNLKQADGKHTGTFLTALTVLDSVALNCGRETRFYLSSSKWMKRLTQNCTENSICSVAVLQLLVNWSHVFMGEELGAAAHAACRQLRSAFPNMPKPNHFAQQMRDMIEQQIPLIGFQHGMNFSAAFLPKESTSEPSSGRSASGGWLQRLQGSSGSQRSHHSAPINNAKADQQRAFFRVEYLAQMEKDVARLEDCSKEIRAQLISNDFSRSTQEHIVRGQDSASRCKQWRTNIQQWVGGDITEEELEQMLRLNDRMHAALSRWHAATTEYAEARSRVQDLKQGGSPSGSTKERQSPHEQWFSPLGSSASRIMSESPSPASSGSSAVELSSGSAPSGISAQLPPASSSVRRGSHNSSGSPDTRLRPPPPPPQQQQQRPPMTAPGSASQGSPTGDLLGGDLLGLHSPPVSAWPVSAAETAQPTILEQSSQSDARASAAPVVNPGQQQTPPLQHVSGAAAPAVPLMGAWEMQWPPTQNPSSLQATSAGHDFWRIVASPAEATPSGPKPSGQGQFNGQAQVSMVAGSDSALSGAAEDLPRKDLGKDAELAALRQQLEEERSGRLDLQHKLQACKLAEERLVADVCLLQSQLRQKSAELQEYKVRAEPRNASTDVSHSGPFSAYCRQPALRLRFSPGEFQALASLMNKY